MLVFFLVFPDYKYKYWDIFAFDPVKYKIDPIFYQKPPSKLIGEQKKILKIAHFTVKSIHSSLWLETNIVICIVMILTPTFY